MAKTKHNKYKTSQDFKHLGDNRWEWSVWIEGEEKDIDAIDTVTYTLDPTFSDQVREINTRNSNFRITESATNGFSIPIKIKLKDGEQVSLEHVLVLTPAPSNRIVPHQIVVKGKRQENALLTDTPQELLKLRDSFVIGSTVRGVGESHSVTLLKDDVVELIFEDDTTWICNPDSLGEVFPEATVQSRSIGGFEIPAVLRSEETERGIISDVSLKVINIFTKKALGNKVKEIASDLERKQLENHSGLYRLNSTFELQEYRPEATSQPYLLFLHGTNSSTKGSFGELAGTQLWTYIQETYRTSVLAFQHETLTKSPLENVRDLIAQLPQNVTLHLISHSRGGLVGDTLARFCHTDEHNRGFDKNEIEYLEKEGRTADIQLIEEIRGNLQKRKIVIHKFIRVACPGGGTILASKRLDNYFNIAFNLVGLGTGLAGSPVYSAFKNLIASVIDYKNDPGILPGLEAMNPDSPFIKILNNPATRVPLDGALIVVAGNCKVKPNLKALLIIASRLFYFRDNDLVVNTRSMYQGSKRTNLVQYYFDEAGDVDHFHYFKNKRTNDAIVDALKATDNTLIPGFSQGQQGALIDMQRNALLNLEGGHIFTNTVTGAKPILVVLPGIMGSNLSQNGELLWINYFRFLKGDLADMKLTTNGIDSPSLIKTSYKKLVDYFGDRYDVVTFPFDWRLQLTRAADKFNDKIKELLTYGQPIKIIGHSMGGVLVRDFIIRHEETWTVLNKSTGFKLIFLGAPLGGSFRIPAVLLGQDPVIDKLSKIDIFHTKKELIQVFSQMPGILSLLPAATTPDTDFSNLATWEKMAGTLEGWPLPVKADLEEFRSYRAAIAAKADDIDYSNTVYIAGRDKATHCGYRIDETAAGKELVFLSTAEGDQSVTWDTGIPKKLVKQNSVYYANVTHGALANEPALFKGMEEILDEGVTNLLSRIRPSVRSDQKLFPTPEKQDFDLSPEGIEKTILGLDAEQSKAGVESSTSIQVSVSNGDLRYAAYPVLAGHFLNDGILYAEKAIDYNLKGALTERHRLAIYPGEIGTSEVLLSEDKDFKGALIVGLGKLGDLTAFQLTQTVEQGVTKYLLDLNSKGLKTSFSTEAIGISSLIIGCGYGGLPIENSIRAIIQGIQNANDKLSKLRTNVRTLQFIEFIELYDDTALNCLYTLNRIEHDENKSLRILTTPKSVQSMFGSRSRLLVNATEGWWNRITVQLVKKPEFEGDVRCLQFSASTGGAREEQRELYSSTIVLEQLIDDISTNNRWSPELAKTVYELLIPNDFKEQLKRHGNINWILDKNTAAYPWELLQDGSSNAIPLCVSAGMIRQLTTQDYRLKINPVQKDYALIIADPELKGFINQLPGAEKEGQQVNALLTEQGYTTTTVIRGSASKIIQALFQDDYKIIHLAGHGIFNEQVTANSNGKLKSGSGMVIGNGVYLSTREITQMSTVPELVFVNCCFLGQTDSTAEEFYRQRYKLAANIGTQLIENGVKAVVVAGWAVDDAAALDFTKVFYAGMFGGYSFGEAVQKARKTIYEKYRNANNTWGAYQCYGDPFYKFKAITKSQKAYAPEFIVAQEALIELNNLSNELETGRYSTEENYIRLDSISKAVDKAGLRNATISEKEAFIYAEMGDYNLAIDKFEQMFQMEKANFSVTTLERYCNIKAKKLVYDYIESGQTKDFVPELEKVIMQLESLLSISETGERYTLLGSAYKRKAMLSREPEQKKAAYKKAAGYYKQAHAIQSNRYFVYALTNWFEIESILVLCGDHEWQGSVILGQISHDYSSSGDIVQLLNQVNESLQPSTGKMEFWDMVIRVNLKLCSLIVDTGLANKPEVISEIVDLYRETWKKAGSKGKKLAEIEHLEILEDGLALIQDSSTDTLEKMIHTAKEELRKML